MQYVGLDLGATSAHFAVTTDGRTFPLEGEITLENLPRLLQDIENCDVPAFGMEWTGRLAAPWIAALHGADIPAYVIHTNNRRALTVLTGTTAKTDPHDARMTAQILRLWHDPSLRRELNLQADLFTAADLIRHAWTLRGLLYDHQAHVRTRVAAQNRIVTAKRIGSEERIAMWEEYAGNGYADLALRVAQRHAREYFPHELDTLKSIPGIGENLALWLVAVLCPITRFHFTDHRGERTARKVLRYVGLYGSTDKSGLMDKSGKPAKRGNRHLRAALTFAAVGAAHPGRRDCFARLYIRLREEGFQTHQIHCRIAAALLRCAVSILRSGQPFTEPRPHEIPAPVEKSARPPGLLTQSEAARRANISRQAIFAAVGDGRILTVQQGEQTLIPEAAFEEWQAKRGMRSKAAPKPSICACQPPDINQDAIGEAAFAPECHHAPV